MLDELAESNIKYLVTTQTLDSLKLNKRTFRKDIPMKDVKDRNGQLQDISS